jgi:hypothetical protein
MDSFEKKALELQEQLYTDGYDYSLCQVKLALSEWLCKASQHLIDNADDYIFGKNQIVGDAFNPEKFTINGQEQRTK